MRGGSSTFPVGHLAFVYKGYTTTLALPSHTRFSLPLFPQVCGTIACFSSCSKFRGVLDTSLYHYRDEIFYHLPDRSGDSIKNVRLRLLLWPNHLSRSRASCSPYAARSHRCTCWSKSTSRMGTDQLSSYGMFRLGSNGGRERLTSTD